MALTCVFVVSFDKHTVVMAIVTAVAAGTNALQLRDIRDGFGSLSTVLQETHAMTLHREFRSQFDALRHCSKTNFGPTTPQVMNQRTLACAKCGKSGPLQVTRAHVVRGHETAAELFLDTSTECNWIPLCGTMDDTGSCHVRFHHSEMGFIAVPGAAGGQRLWVAFTAEGDVFGPFPISTEPHARVLHLFAAKVHLDCLARGFEGRLNKGLAAALSCREMETDQVKELISKVPPDEATCDRALPIPGAGMRHT